MMRKMILMLFVTLLFTFAAASVIQVARGQQGGDANTISRETQGENLREIVGMGDAEAARAPHIGFIDSPSATCYQPDPGIDACHLTWYYLAVDAAPNYMITMTLSLNAIGAVAHISWRRSNWPKWLATVGKSPTLWTGWARRRSMSARWRRRACSPPPAWSMRPPAATRGWRASR